MNSKEIKEYLLQNPIDRTKANPYVETANKFGVHPEAIRTIWRKLRAKGLVETEININYYSTLPPNAKLPDYVITTSTQNGKEYEYKESRRPDGSVQIEDTVDRKLTDEELFERYGRNQKEWRIISVWFKDKRDGFLLSVHFAPIKVDQDLGLQKDVILGELKDALRTHKPKTFQKKVYKSRGKLLLELALFDVHFGKLSHEEESGEDYDLKIAAKRYKNAIDDLLSKVNLENVGRILFPIGQDLFNIDNINKTTTNFTPQDNDTRFHKMVKIVKNVLIETIDYLSTIAPVDVVIVVGNHDTTVTFLVGEVLDAYYHGNRDVDINNATKLRKYYSFGNTAFMFSHGDREKQNDLGMIFAAEEPQIWASATQRYIQIGHYHHNKKISYLANNEFQGFQVQILPSLSPNDAWHSGKGYSALRQAKAFLFDREKGLVSELTYTA